MGYAEPGDRTPPATAKCGSQGRQLGGAGWVCGLPMIVRWEFFLHSSESWKRPMNCEIPIFLDFSSLEMHQNHIPELRPEPWATLHAALSQAL